MGHDGQAALWLAVIALGAFHGLNPAMGWPLAVANGLMAQRGTAVFATMAPLSLGHLGAMALAVLPFALLSGLVQHGQAVRLGAGVLLLGYGVYRLAVRRHPRMMARIPPTHLAWWSFVMALAHGAGLMLVPVALGLCATAPAGAAGLASAQDSAQVLLRSGLATAAAATVVHTLAMVASGVGMAWLVYRVLGLAFLRRVWLNLDRWWALSLVAVGAATTAMAAWPT